jgi:anti-anti-sigma factor
VAVFKMKPEKMKKDILAEIAQYPFYKNSQEDGYNHLFSIFKELLGAPCCYLYLVNENADKLILESSNFSGLQEWQAVNSLEKDVLDFLQAPDLSIKFKPIYENFGIIENWGIDLINVPLHIQTNEYIGVLLAGPNPDKKINQKINERIDAISKTAAAAIKTIKEYQLLRDEIRSLTSRTQVSKRMLGSALEVNRFVDLLLDLALTATKAESGFVAITDTKKRTMTVRAQKNIPEKFVEKLDLSAQNGLFEWSTDMADILILRDYDFINQFEVKSILAVPLVEKKTLIGVFALISFKNKNYFSEFSLSILTNFTEQIKLILNNSKLFDEFTERYFSTLIAMSIAYDFRSPFTAGHSQRVANIAAEIAWFMKLPPKQIEHIKDAGLIHDVGLCGVVEISEGFQADYNHPEIGANMIEVLPISKEVIEGVKTHHEWYDGWGFPQGLKENQIPLSGRILGVAEFFSEATANSLMKPATDWKKLVDELDLRNGSQFDPEVVNSLKSLLLQKRHGAKKNQIEKCWKFKGEPENICSNCPAFESDKQFCWSHSDVFCEKHGDALCDNCFIFAEWVDRIENLINQNKIEVSKMEHNIQQKGELTVLNLAGEIDVAAAPQLKNVFKSLIDAGKVNIIVDLKDVDFIDSSGLGIFVVGYKSAKAKGGKIKFSSAKPEVIKVIELTRLDKHFELFQNTEQAELSFQ